MPAWLRSFGAAAAVAACSLAGPAAVTHGQGTPPPCPAGTTLANVDASATDTDVIPTPTGITATHHSQFDATLGYPYGAAVSPNEDVTITPSPGLDATTVPGDGSRDTASVTFVAPAGPGTLAFTVTWTQLESHGSKQDCTGSAEIPVAVAPAVANRAGHVFGAIQHWPGHPGARQNVLSLGWVVEVDAKRGDATPVTVSVRAVNGRRLPSLATPAVTSTWNPFDLHVKPLVAHSNLIRLRSATTGFDSSATHIEDVVNASVFVYPSRRGARTRRGIAVDIAQGSTILASYRLVTTCRRRPHRGLTCRPMPGQDGS
jgi:hypothetical protein